jgi:DUF971 family protein
MSDRPRPTEIKLLRASRVLEIAFSDGARFRLPCEYLRIYSPSAEVRGHVAAEWKLVDSYAVKLIFDDGHKTGLYDWRYLYKLGQNAGELWELYLERLRRAGKQRRGTDPFAALESA